MGVGVTAPLSHSVGLVRLQFQHTTQKKRGFTRVFFGHKYHNHLHNSISIISNCTTTTTTTATSGGGVLGVKELKERCKKWEWKGQYSITYFVSHSSNSNNNNNNKPPLLLVHGFGASIPHWRRLVFFNFIQLHFHISIQLIDIIIDLGHLSLWSVFTKTTVICHLTPYPFPYL